MNSLVQIFLTENLEILLYVIVFLLCVYLGLVVYLKKPNSTTNKFFALLATVLAAYVLVNYLSLHPPGGSTNQLLWINIVMFVCSFIGPLLLLLIHTFPSEKFSLNKKILFLIFLLAVLSAGSSLTSLVFRGIEFPGEKPLPIPGPAMPIFLIDFVGLFIGSFILLIIKYKRASIYEKKFLGTLGIGVIMTFTLMAVTTVISVIFLKTSAVVLIGPLSSGVLVTFVAYSIIKHHIFNIRILLTEFLVAFFLIILVAQNIAVNSEVSPRAKLVIVSFILMLGFILLRSAKHEIEHERQLEHVRTVESLYSQIAELDRQKTEFLTIAAHQLRTPVSIIKNYVSMLSDGDYGQIPDSIKDVLTNIDQSSQWLVRLGDEFLNIANLEQGQTKYHMERCDMQDIIADVVSELAPKAERSRVSIDWQKQSGSCVLSCDKEKMRAVIFNFIDNALKYGVGDNKDTISRITITLEQKDNGCTVKVSDNGIGFDVQDEERFFQKFSRGVNAQAIHVNLSTGLGLYICRKFVEGHRGIVWAKSVGPGRGSEFGFWVPNGLVS